MLDRALELQQRHQLAAERLELLVQARALERPRELGLAQMQAQVQALAQVAVLVQALAALVRAQVRVALALAELAQAQALEPLEDLAICPLT